MERVATPSGGEQLIFTGKRKRETGANLRATIASQTKQIRNDNKLIHNIPSESEKKKRREKAKMAKLSRKKNR